MVSYKNHESSRAEAKTHSNNRPFRKYEHGNYRLPSIKRSHHIDKDSTLSLDLSA